MASGNWKIGIGLILMLGLLVGCSQDGPPIADVEGQVLLDGAPLSDAEVTFSPQSAGRHSVGKTDQDGRFELRYSGTRTGALVGDHTVKISTFQAPHPAGPNGEMSPLKKERVPKRYNVNSELTRTVDKWGSEFTFELESK